MRRDLADEVVDVGEHEVGVAVGQPFQHRVEHGGGLVADAVADRVFEEAAVLVHGTGGVAVEGGGEGGHVVGADPGHGSGRDRSSRPPLPWWCW